MENLKRVNRIIDEFDELINSFFDTGKLDDGWHASDIILDMKNLRDKMEADEKHKTEKARHDANEDERESEGE